MNFLNPVKDWFISSGNYLNVLFYWLCAVSATASIIYYVLSKDCRGYQFTIKCILVYVTVEIVLGAIK